MSDWEGQAVVKVTIHQGALMETTREFIPVRSTLEKEVADKLVAQNRHFNKPLRFDAEENLVFPDFLLLDAGVERGMPMEVFGRSDENHQVRRGEISKHYDETFGVGQWWSWIAAGREQTVMPKLPPKARGL